MGCEPKLMRLKPDSEAFDIIEPGHGLRLFSSSRHVTTESRTDYFLINIIIAIIADMSFVNYA